MRVIHIVGRVTIAALLVSTSLTAANAAPTTFFGEDVNGPYNDPNALSSWANSNTAKTSFLSNLVGVGTETFDGLAVNTTNPALSFPGAGTATLTGTGYVGTGNDGSGRYAISSPNYYYAGTDNFGVTFGQPVAAFGFYGIDIGDFGGQLTLTLTDTSNNTTVLTVPNQVSYDGEISGSVLYYGFYDTTDQYVSVVFGNNSGGQDVFGFDNLTVGSIEQVHPTTVPEPASLTMLAASLAGLGVLRQRRRKA
ncbi:PEP-CTERM sorting domain-containing protein [Telmatospirillum sp.]|uniref:PEP-CTERM sorting domain-containing protein n=1 Tax=Telmatospirillum sp. TaxID=2079197 RepID=UPI002843A097|nr:PEP-CTERM sorting domain-containing protein [Telmatospirillum sp.]MDR3439135.1 PEP-CTERM sorting domain-containing protein [Telmatospirillum sp.]